MRASPARGVLVGLAAALANFGIGALMMVGDCEPETATVKGEVRVLSPEVTGVKVEFNVNTGAAQSPPGMDERAGQKGATEYEGRPLKCRDDGSGTKTCW